MTAANHVCPQGDLECYGISLKTVCGPVCEDNPDTCPSGMQCVTFLNADQTLLGKACETT